MVSNTDSRKQLVERIVASRYLNKSARLTEMFVYLSRRVLDEAVDDIHEQEVGCKVFGRPPQYDTTADNIVRVHASMLRKRIHQYFDSEGSEETLVIEIPRGNYAPMFRERELLPANSDALQIEPPEAHWPKAITPMTHPEGIPVQPGNWDWKRWLPIFLTLFFALTSLFLLLKVERNRPSGVGDALANKVLVHQFWSQIFHPDDPVQIVLDDAAVDFYQKITQHPVALSEYFDRSYLQSVDESAAAGKLDRDLVQSFILRRVSSYSDATLIWKLAQTAGALRSDAEIQFAREFSFRQMKSGNLILLGNPRSNPWIQSFESRSTLRWKFDAQRDSFYPYDALASVTGQEKFHIAAPAGKTHEGYATISFLSNLGENGDVLIITGTGGSSIGAAMNFLSDERSMGQLRSRLHPEKATGFPHFEMLLKVEKGSSLPGGTSIVICRSAENVSRNRNAVTGSTPAPGTK